MSLENKQFTINCEFCALRRVFDLDLIAVFYILKENLTLQVTTAKALNFLLKMDPKL